MSSYDGIIIGAGHNGLILQAYLGKAGLRTISIKRPEPPAPPMAPPPPDPAPA